MLPIHQLLARFKNLTNTEKVKKELIVEIFTKNNIPVNVKQMSIIKNTIFVKTQPIIKTELLLKKDIILSEIHKIPGLSSVLDIV